MIEGKREESHESLYQHYNRKLIVVEVDVR